MRLQIKFISFIICLACLRSAFGAGIDLPASGSWLQPGQLDLGGSSPQIGGTFNLANVE